MPMVTPSTETATATQTIVKTVRTAQTEYLQSGEGSIHKGFRDVIKALVKSGYPKPIPNDCYADALFLTDIMLEHTERSFRMLSGQSGDGFITTLETNFKKMLVRLHEVGGKAKVILIRRPGQAAQTRKLNELQKEIPGVLEFATGVAEHDLKHYIVSDSQMLRLEDVHPPLTDETPADAIKAQVYMDAPVRAKMQEESFESIWNILHPKK